MTSPRSAEQHQPGAPSILVKITDFGVSVALPSSLSGGVDSEPKSPSSSPFSSASVSDMVILFSVRMTAPSALWSPTTSACHSQWLSQPVHHFPRCGRYRQVPCPSWLRKWFDLDAMTQRSTCMRACCRIRPLSGHTITWFVWLACVCCSPHPLRLDEIPGLVIFLFFFLLAFSLMCVFSNEWSHLCFFVHQ